MYKKMFSFIVATMLFLPAMAKEEQSINYFESYLDKMRSSAHKFESLSLGVQCKTVKECSDFREGSLELLFQYSDEINFINHWRILEEIQGANLPSSGEDFVDWKLLSRKLSFAKTYSQNFTKEELSTYKEKLCVYSGLLNPEEQQALDCQFIEEVSGIAQSVADLLSHDIHNNFNRTQMFMMCRKERKYPCYMLLKNIEGNFHLDSKGEIWGQPSLGFSRKDKGGTQKDGDTPAGILLVNSVMPSANKKYIFGDYRRLILDFVSNDTARLLLPQSHLDQKWWEEAQIADAVGRKYLRIHGTGQRNSRSSRAYYPFVATRGCVAQRENRYRDLDADFKDQKLLLDNLMMAQDLEPVYNNHTKIRSVLYVLELDDANRSVTREDALSYFQ